MCHKIYIVILSKRSIWICWGKNWTCFPWDTKLYLTDLKQWPNTVGDVVDSNFTIFGNKEILCYENLETKTSEKIKKNIALH